MGSRWNTEVEEVAPRSAPLPVPYPSFQPLPSSPQPHFPSPAASSKRNGMSDTSTSDERMNNPQQLKYLMRAGHYQKTSPSPPPLSPPIPSTAASRISAHTQAPALNSTAQLLRKAQALASEVFEEDAEEVRAEVERRAKDVVKPSKNSLDFAPNEQRYVNLIPIDAPTPEPALPRRSAAKPSAASARRTHATPSITGECFERNAVSPRFGVVTRSVYVQPVTTPACDATPHASLRVYLRDHAEI